ncbi:FAD-dependent oxidoreductase [Natronoglycomyces albus]|uniref:FAD-dependent monooxygenase n=1 Tax=Natronoglycomyces albus TaxID=2811108 RepID=A0A895XH37_9ACTN|nr:NAD(P)/FAD-dependent oxidoreductase [Natronoglycomyces albus]QSB04227.1 FAD-dependent monooxygenase [Natronoglycomyces albus]
MNTPKAVVVGAGIAGLATAIALSQLNWRVALLEQRPRLRGDDTGALVWPNGIRAAASLGLANSLEAVSHPVSNLRLRKIDGGTIATVGPQLLSANSSEPTMILQGAAFHEALVSHLGSNVEVHPSTAVTRIDLVHLAAGDATRRWEADLIVAADGTDSILRHHIDETAKVTSASTVMFQATIPPHRAPDLDSDAVITFGPANRRFSYASLGQTGAAWAATVPGGLRPESDQIQHELINRWFADWPEPIGQLIGATRPGELSQSAVRYLWPLPSDFQHCTDQRGALLVGDAAHALAPELAQGTSLALEDAATLKWCLTNSAGITAALALFEKVRRPRVTRLARQARRLHNVAGRSTGVAGQLLRAAPGSLIGRQIKQGFDWHLPGGGGAHSR